MAVGKNEVITWVFFSVKPFAVENNNKQVVCTCITMYLLQGVGLASLSPTPFI